MEDDVNCGRLSPAFRQVAEESILIFTNRQLHVGSTRRSLHEEEGEHLSKSSIFRERKIDFQYWLDAIAGVRLKR